MKFEMLNAKFEMLNWGNPSAEGAKSSGNICKHGNSEIVLRGEVWIQNEVENVVMF